MGRVAQGRYEDAHARLERLVPTVPAHLVPVHRHVEPHIVLVERGTYLSAAEGAQDDGQTMLIFNPAGTEHDDCFAEGQDLSDARFTSVSIGFPMWQDLGAGLDAPGHAVAVCGPPAQAVLLGAHALLRIPGTDPTRSLALQVLVAEALGAVASRQVSVGRSMPTWLRRCRDALGDDDGAAMAPGGLARLAADAGVHPVHLARAFRKHFACSPGEYARRLRMERAAAALARSTKSLATIAHEAGYFDQAHFTRGFTAAFGVSPARYRQRASDRRTGREPWTSPSSGA